MQNLQRTSMNSHTQKKNQKVSEGYEQTLLKRRHLCNQQTYEKSSPPLVIREMQVKSTTRYHLIPVRMVIIQKSGNNCCWRGCGHFYTVGGSIN